MNETVGLILAGGSGQRLGGVRKADLKLGGTRLLDRVSASTGLADVIVSIGHHPPSTFSKFESVVVPDLTTETGGPLAGLAAAVKHLSKRAQTPEFILSTAVDVPFLPANFGCRMRNGIGSNAAAFVQWGDNFYPTNALWRLRTLADLPDRVQRGAAPKNLKRLLQEIGAVPVTWDDAFDPFSNVNTLADLLELTRRIDRN
ncbi:NTP transferase domain-containing protein [Devosia rhodophyticola]|uniref:Molybdenum cofactor guanylyltransferase n=1 Tax=Devosia rhodophyticola TaxID=3026423 RepID=A0ABY7YXD2_9HYPH|nr:NTP transferase domain-containing protein [Devosia rhodophyticola]WDR05872.1 NTP transferase domain-containing protein [Devosia rhodophyticola]